MAALFTAGKFQAIDNLGLAAPGALLYTYQAGTLVAQVTYTSQAETTPNANPVVCDAGGKADVWLNPAFSYRFILKTALGVTIYDVDNLANGIADFSSNTDAAKGPGLIGGPNATLAYAAGTLGDHFRYYASPSDAPYLADRTGVTDATTALTNCISNNANTVVLPGTYLLASLVSIAATGNNKTLYFMPGVTLVSSQPPTVAQGILQFFGTGDRLKIVGNGVQIKYTTAPTVRTNHVVYVRGTTITNLEIEGLDILNGPNVAVMILAGNDSSAATGSKNVRVHDIKTANHLGDTIHVEGFDSGVMIYDIYSENPGDDVVFVGSYNGTGSAPTHNSQTTGVIVKGIRGTGVKTHGVSFGGVGEFVVDDIQIEGNVASAAAGVNLAQGASYTVGNSNGTVDNVATTGCGASLVFGAAGAVTASLGSQFCRDIRVGKVVSHNVQAQAVSITNAGTAAGGAVKNIEIAQLELHGGAAAATVGLITSSLNVRIGSIYADGFGAGLLVGSNAGFSWGSFKASGFLAATTYGIACLTNTNIRPGSIELDGTNCATGIQFQSNAGVIHDGYWSVTGTPTATHLFGSNSLLRGYFDIISGFATAPGAVTDGSTTVITYARSVPSGAAQFPKPIPITNVKAASAVTTFNGTTMTITWNGAQTVGTLLYEVGVQAA